MIRYTCDRCGKQIDPDSEVRYSVKIEINAALDPVSDEQDDDDRDHLLEIHEILERMDDQADPAISDDIYQRISVDLCPDCCRRFAKDPLGKETATQFDFSAN